eukprot:c26480_g1_i2 orf=617-3121(-)
MASSLYQNSGPGRPPPAASYRQNQHHPAPPPAHLGAPNRYSYGSGLPPPPPQPPAAAAYSSGGPPPPMVYNPSYAYGSGLHHSSASYGGVLPQGQFHSSHRHPPYPISSLPSSSLPATPSIVPSALSQPSHHSLPFSSSSNSVRQPSHPPYYPSSLPPLPRQLPHPASHPSSSHGKFSSSFSQQPLPPPSPPPPAQDSMTSSIPLSSHGDPSSNQPPVASGRLNPSQGNHNLPQNSWGAAGRETSITGRFNSGQGNHDLSQNHWGIEREAGSIDASRGNWSSARDITAIHPSQGAWSLSSPQAAVPHQPSEQGIANSQGPTVGTVPTQFPVTTKLSKPVGGMETSRPASALRADNRFESEQRRRDWKKRENERKKIEENRREKETQSSTMLQKTATSLLTKFVPSSKNAHADQKSLPSTEKVENRLKRPSTFLCKIRFRNELPDPLAQPKLLHGTIEKDQYTKYMVTSLENSYKHRLLVEPDLGIPLDLLDITVYNAPKVKPPMDPEDEELLVDDEFTPTKVDSIRKKDRPTDKGVAWLVKTQYISPVSLDHAKQPLTEKQAKELKERREGRGDFLETLNDREQQIQSIEESFIVAKDRPVHQTKPGLEPVEILPLLPDFDRLDDQLVHIVFDGEPTVDSELHSKLDTSLREELESKAIMKSFVLPGTETQRPEKFLAYMVPKIEEVVRDIYDDDDDDEIQYTWVREYHWDIRAEDAHNTLTYLFSFGEESARYLPLGTKLTVQKKKAKEGRSKDEVESQYAIPSSVTVRRRGVAHEEEQEMGRQRHSLMEGLTSATQETGHAKRRQSPDAEMPPSKRKVSNADMSDDDDGLSV